MSNFELRCRASPICQRHKGYDRFGARLLLAILLGYHGPCLYAGLLFCISFLLVFCLIPPISFNGDAIQYNVVYGFLTYAPLEIPQSYVYPDWLNALGITIALSPAFAIPIVAVYQFYRARGNTFFAVSLH